jgi:hypothetical protein
MDVHEVVNQITHHGLCEVTFLKKDTFSAFLLDMKRQILASWLRRREILERSPNIFANQEIEKKDSGADQKVWLSWSLFFTVRQRRS